MCQACTTSFLQDLTGISSVVFASLTVTHYLYFKTVKIIWYEIYNIQFVSNPTHQPGMYFGGSLVRLTRLLKKLNLHVGFFERQHNLFLRCLDYTLHRVCYLLQSMLFIKYTDLPIDDLEASKIV